MSSDDKRNKAPGRRASAFSRVWEQIKDFFQNSMVFGDDGEWRQILDAAEPGEEAEQAARRLEKSIRYRTVLISGLAIFALIAIGLILSAQLSHGVNSMFHDFVKEFDRTVPGEDVNPFFESWRASDPHSYFLLLVVLTVGAVLLIAIAAATFALLFLGVAVLWSVSANKDRLQLIIHYLTKGKHRAKGEKELDAV